jgi:hypothetical protein
MSRRLIMNEQDKFEVRYQEIVDAHTGATITLGSHAGSGNKWMRIAVSDLLVGAHDSKTKTSTITFGPDGQALKILPHVQAPTGYYESEPAESGSPRVLKIKEEMHHLDEVEASLRKPTNEDVGYDEDKKFDKSTKHGKK